MQSLNRFLVCPKEACKTRKILDYYLRLQKERKNRQKSKMNSLVLQKKCRVQYIHNDFCTYFTYTTKHFGIITFFLDDHKVSYVTFFTR